MRTPEEHARDLAEMSPGQRAAAARAEEREWFWNNPECQICDKNHPPDKCDPADLAAALAAMEADDQGDTP